MMLLALGWSWARVAQSSVLHLVPRAILHGSRTACGRLSVFDTSIEIPYALVVLPAAPAALEEEGT